MSRSTRERWAELVKVALVGTGRQALGEPAFADLQASGVAPEAALLGEAAALALHERAGRLPPTIDLTPAPAPPETLPRAPEAATRELTLLLAAEPALVPEWLRLCAARGRRVDERLLPELLEYGRSRLEQRAAVVAVVGARGLWLAAEEPVWRWVAAGAHTLARAAWETGSRAERLAFLVALRKTDPAAARELVARSFAAETPEDRAELVARFAVGLGAADEPFLEEALDDRRKEVRLAAARVLYGLPTARLGGRMALRARKLVPDAGGPGQVILPEAPDASGLRDGLEATPPRGEGPRAFYLRQILAATPLAVWGSPDSALASVAKSEWRETVVLGWALATARQRDARWAEALLGVTLQVPELVRIVAPERRDALVLAILARAEPADIPLVLRQLDPPFGESVSRGALVAVKRACLGVDADVEGADAPRANRQTARALLAELVVDLAPALLDPLAQALAAPRKTPWHAALSSIVHIVERRLALQRSFKEPA